MARTERTEHQPQFLEQGGDFNDQLYKALRASPWWMISIAFHVLLGVILSLMASDVPPGGKNLQVTASMNAAEPPPLEDPPPTPEETEQIQQQDVVAKEPTVKDAELSDHNETDNDLPTEESLGEAGISDAPFEGPANNGLIGIGGSAGGAFKGRGGHRNLRAGGGGKKADDAVEDALRWLAAHQSSDGGWECEGFRKWCDGKTISGEGPDGAGKAQYDVGVTGMALLAFLGAGYTNRSEGPFGKVVGNGLKYLRNVQDAEGCFGSRSSGHFVYNHAIAALAMVEAYGMTGSTNFKNPAQKALDFIAISRNPYFAWRYGIKPGDNDTSVTGWMMMALKSAKLINQADVKAGKPASLQYDEEAFDGIKAWVEKMTDPDYGRVGYQQRGTGPARPTELVDKFPADKSESMTGVGMLARIFLGENPKTSDPIKKGAELCVKVAPKWDPNDGSIDMYYWYYATLAMFQVGGAPWDAWQKAMKTAIIDTQRKDTDYCMFKGSWDPIDPWGPDGGRVYSTACLALCLEVWYRYDKVFGAAGDK
ncbi:MAG: terpene cyclase/mutase family protein [Planctomycetia bacterium]|nr:terpene cyclase/mutase family protein [Planctomycetia bacterium]